MSPHLKNQEQRTTPTRKAKLFQTELEKKGEKKCPVSQAQFSVYILLCSAAHNGDFVQLLGAIHLL